MQIGVEHQRNDKFLPQGIFLGVHAVIGKNLKTVNQNAIGTRNLIGGRTNDRGSRRRDIRAIAARKLCPFNRRCAIGQFLATHANHSSNAVRIG